MPKNSGLRAPREQRCAAAGGLELESDASVWDPPLWRAGTRHASSGSEPQRSGGGRKRGACDVKRTSSRTGVFACVGIMSTVLSLGSWGCGDETADSACSDWCAVVESCTGTAFVECVDGCEAEFSRARARSGACANAVSRQNVCVSGLSCADFERWLSATLGDDYPCKGADDRVRDACSL